MKKIISLLMVWVALLFSCTSHAQQNPTDKSSNADKATEKTLVVFFSHTGENYAVGNIKVGNTKRVADAISAITGADLFEIVADKSYDMPYTPLTKVAQQETENNEFPTYKGSVDVSQYSTVYIGGPIWWGTYPRVMFTFFRDNDLNGKTIIPFSTHEGSGMGSIQSDVEKAYPDAEVRKGFAIRGTDCQKNDVKDKVAKLIEKY